MDKAIIYIGNFRFPLGDAVAKRALGIGKALLEVGIKTLFIGESEDIEKTKISPVKEYLEYKYCSIHHSKTAKEHMFFLTDLKNIKNQIDIWQNEYIISSVVLCGTKSVFLAHGIISYCKKKKLTIIADSMDWLMSRTGNILFDVIKQLDTTLEIKCENRRVNGVICISNYLSEFYKKYQKKTIVIPPLSPYEKRKYSKKINPLPSFIYTGIPCRLGSPLKNPSDAKDRLDLIIEVFYQIFIKGYRFIFYIYGLTFEDYCIVFPKQKEQVQEMIQSGDLRFMGYQNEEIVREAISQVDFSVLFREKNRVSEAGFPTKVSESITLGTPVITTNTSDLKIYLSDNHDAVFVDLCQEKEIVETIIDLIQSDKALLQMYKLNASVNQCFTPNQYSQALLEFIRLCEVN